MQVLAASRYDYHPTINYNGIISILDKHLPHVLKLQPAWNNVLMLKNCIKSLHLRKYCCGWQDPIWLVSIIPSPLAAMPPITIAHKDNHLDFSEVHMDSGTSPRVNQNNNLHIWYMIYDIIFKLFITAKISFKFSLLYVGFKWRRYALCVCAHIKVNVFIWSLGKSYSW